MIIRPVILSGGSGTRLWPLSLLKKTIITIEDWEFFGLKQVKGNTTSI